MCNEKKDFSLLRPFDLEAAKRGDAFVFISPVTGEQKTRKLIAEKNGQLVVDYGDTFQITTIDFAADGYRMAPLCWVRTSVEDDTLKPVYKGDVLYSLSNNPDHAAVLKGESQRIRNITENRFLYSEDGWHILPQNLTFTPPKGKRKVSLLGFIHCSTKEVLLREEHKFYGKESWKRSPQLDTTIEIEE